MPNTAVRVGEGAAVFCLGQVTFNSHPYMSVFASKITIFTVAIHLCHNVAVQGAGADEGAKVNELFSSLGLCRQVLPGTILD